MSEVETKRGFKGVWIPKEIWLSPNLSLQEKVFLVEIESLDNEDGCFASNAHFAKFFGLSKGRVSQVITELEKKDLITCEYIYGENKNITKRIVRVVRKLNTPIKETKQGYIENAEGSNTSTSNTKSSRDIYSVYEHWQTKEIIKHREFTQGRKSAINARLQVYSVDELIQAIDNYKEILIGKEYFFSYEWNIETFMKAGNVERFTNEANPFNNFKIESNNKSNQQRETIDEIRRTLKNEQRTTIEHTGSNSNKLLEF